MAMILKIVFFLLHGYNIAAMVTVTKTVCENESIDIKCPLDTGIIVTSAFFGRLDSTTCVKEGEIKNIECGAQNTTTLLEQKCNGEQSCHVSALSNINVFGDPCPGTAKYLSLQYRCYSIANRPVKSKTVCQNEAMDIACEDNLVISVEDVTYGRIDKLTCYRKGLVNEIGCKSESSLKTARKLCDGKPTCRLQASTEKMGKACSYAFQYLNVKYKCRSTTHEVTICQKNEMEIQCPKHHVIGILDAMYGRSNTKTCNNRGNVSFLSAHRTICTSTPTIIEEVCNGKQNCLIKASNDFLDNHDLCPKTNSYLQVKYECTKGYSLQKF